MIRGGSANLKNLHSFLGMQKSRPFFVVSVIFASDIRSARPVGAGNGLY